jgi:trans-aconitate methyltransferase
VTESLDDLGIKHNTDKSSKVHDYLGHYEHHLAPLRPGDGVVLCEVGVLEGDSVRMWAEWLPQAQVIGVDIDLRQVRNVSALPGNVRLVQSGITDWQAPPESFDVLIDDGSHLDWQVADVMVRFWPALRPGGFLVVEDWAAQFVPPWQGDPVVGSAAVRQANKFLERALRPECDDVAELHAYAEGILFIRKSP